MPFENPIAPDLDVHRYPKRANDPLQAWDAADHLLLEHLSSDDSFYQMRAGLRPARILILQDAFGALTCALQHVSNLEITTYNDAYTSNQAITSNISRCHPDPIESKTTCRVIHLLDDMEGHYDLVLMKLPKSMSFLEDILARLTHHIAPNGQLIIGGMVKHIARASFDLIATYIGQTHTSLAKKKARLIFASFEKDVTASPYPIEVNLDGFSTPFLHHANLFSRHKLDIGTRFFLEHVPQGDFQHILDLGCANGIIGIKAQQLNPEATIHMSDDSQMAILSAQHNMHQHTQRSPHLYWTNCFEGQPANQLDLVLCNPPFHQNHTIGSFIAKQMFADARHALKPGGTLRVIGNHHLRYHHVLKQRFGNANIVAKNKKFMIIDAIKPIR